jgi:hypothetical protein
MIVLGELAYVSCRGVVLLEKRVLSRYDFLPGYPFLTRQIPD